MAEPARGAQPVPGQPYPGTAVAAAVIAALFFPIVSLIVALLLLGAQQDEAKRLQLRTWAWASGAWLVAQVVFAVMLVGCVGSSGSEIDPVVTFE